MSEQSQQSVEAPVAEQSRSPLRVVLVLALIALLLVAACAAVLVFRPPFADPVLETLGLTSHTTPATSSTKVQSFAETSDAGLNQQEQAAYETRMRQLAQTPFIARYADLVLCSPIRPMDLTGVMFHQASNDYALILSTELPEADYETIEETRSMRINHDQAGAGQWLDAEAMHLWRTADSTEMDTSIDVGALAGTTVVSPVDGTVVLIRDYRLYDELDDIEIHIQPDGHPELDVVLIHTTDPLVKVGDRLEAGVTPLSHVRNIDDFLTDVQLGFFTPEGVGGNHTHVQVNDATFPNYRETRLAGAIVP